ncbi:MAG: response regulator [Bacteroidota bacterium]
MANQLKILLVDDDEDDRDIFAIALKTAQPDAQLFTAQNGPECLEKLDAGGFVPDFIFLDLNMPYMHGNKCLEELKKRPDLKDVPVLIYTTSSNRQDAEETQKAGAANFLVKPTSLSALSQILEHILQGKASGYFIEG